MATTTTSAIFDKISLRIIKEQELIIGPIAWEEAGKVPGVKVLDSDEGRISISGNGPEILNKLVAQYARLFGQASTEACKEAVQDLLAELPQDEVPESLR